ncbi:MAG: RagB/SusD family nutrient uptake outer membrane protein [Prevotellaceae bacterium]|jgi:hypothetical protein|nr:RagB/SusD family nutrient uptake outer membrane protein [Prevotellaceae bacterium]
MKTKIILLLILFGGVLASSCGDFLSETPSTSLPPDEAITGISDLKYAINGVMAYAIRYEYYGGDFIAYGDLKGSDMYSIGTSNQISPVGRYNHDQYSSFSFNFYSVGYIMLAQINALLDKIPGLPDGNDRKELEGELYALRGLVHFDLARLFAQLPSVAADSSAPDSGIPIADRVFPVDHKPVRSTLAETYNQVINDLTKAIELLSPDKKVNGRINYWAAKALRAKVYLYLEKNSDALADADEVITGSSYTLLKRAEYVGSWAKEGASETLFEFLTTDLYNAQRNSIGYYCAAEGYGEVAVRDTFRTLIDTTTDVRAELIRYEKASSNAGYYPKKYPGRAGSSVPLYANNPKVIRLSEVYLIAAEAAAKGATGAHTAEYYVNTLLAERISGYTDVSSVTVDDILLERRKELFAEGQMCWDAWRNGKSVDNNATNAAKEGKVAPTHPFCILPFPQSEIDISPGLKQNPGYN